MKRAFRVLMLLGLAGILFALPVLAAYSATVRVIETSNTSYTELPIIASVDNDYLATEGYITATGLDTRVESGGVAVPHLVADDKLLFSDGISANTTSNYQYTTGNIALPDFYTIVGYDGYVTFPDAALIELFNNFEVEQYGYVDTSGGSQQNLVHKPLCYRTYVSATDNITADVMGFNSPHQNLNVGHDNVADTGVQWLGQTFTVAITHTITSVKMYVYRTGAPGLLTMYIVPVDGVGKPTTPVLSSGTTDADTFGAGAGAVAWEEIGVSPYELTAGIRYAMWFTVAAGLDPANKVHWRFDGTAPDPYATGQYCWSADEINWTLVVNTDFMFEEWGNVPIRVTALGVSPGEHIVTVKTELQSMTFYSDAGVNSVDGYANQNIALGTLLWNDLTTGVGTDAQDGFTTMLVRWDNHADVNEYKRLDRAITLFDTSALPDTAVPASATLSVWGYGKDDPQNNTPNINVYASAPVADNALVAGDYDSLGAVAFCDAPITYAGFNDAGYNDFALNASGLAVIDVAGVSKFGLRNANYDVANNPPVWAAGTTTQFQMRTVEQGAGFAPTLVVNYYELVIYIDTFEEDRETLGVGVSDNATNWAIMENNVIPYMDYMTIDVAGAERLRYQPTDMISGTTLIDETGANDGTITWGANPTGLSVTMGSMISESQPTPTIVGAAEAPADIAPTITQPANYFTGRDMSANPLHAIIHPLANLSGFNESWIWLGSASIIVLAGMVWILAKLKNQLLAGIAGFALIALFYSMGIYPFWVLIVYSLIAVAIVVFEKVQSV